MVLSLSTLQTEARNPCTTNIDTVSTLELCRIINTQDSQIAPAVASCLLSIAAAIDAIAERVRKGGRMISFGAGTSGRLGVLDASELPPTFHASASQFIGLIAGGDAALRSSIEDAEDSPHLGARDLLLQSPTPNDVVLGIASSGRTPYVLGALNKGREEGCLTVGIACTSPSEMGTSKAKDGSTLCDIIIQCVTGAEVVTGSTRLKAGSATKMILNMISTGVMIKLGKTYGNLMVDLKAANNKLQIRTRNIVHSLCPDGVHLPSGEFLPAPSAASAGGDKMAWDAAVDALIKSADGSVKLAILVARLGCPVVEGKQRLDAAGGVLAVALGEKGKNEEAETVMSKPPGNHTTVLEHDGQRLVLCIDGGGTKTAAAIAEHGGGILARGEAGMSNFMAVGLHATLEAIKLATITALAKIPASKLPTPSLKFPSSTPIFAKLSVGVAGVDRPQEFAVLLPALADLFSLSQDSIRLTNDSLLLASPIQSNPETREGVVVIAGTGSIAISYRTEGREESVEGRRYDQLLQVRRSGGWGHLLGDEGSAFMTGRSAIRSVLNATDIREELRPWHKEILNHFGAVSEHQLISCVVSLPSEGMDPHEAENARKVRIAACAGIALRAFESGDSAAREVIKGSTREIINMIAPLVKSASYPEGVTPNKSTLCLGGGLMKQRSFWEFLVEEMEAVEGWKWNKVEVVEDAATTGASLLANEPW